MPSETKQKGEQGKEPQLSQLAQAKQPIKSHEANPPKRKRRESMMKEYQAEDPIHSTKRNAPLRKNAKMPAKSRSKTNRHQPKTKDEYIKRQEPSQQSSSSSSSSSPDGESETSSSNNSQECVEKTCKQVKRHYRPKASNKKSYNQEANSNISKSKAKGYVYKPPKAKPVQKQQSINQKQRQFSKISRKKVRKSNFYLDKIDNMKWGLPVGRGAKRLKQQMEQKDKIRKEREKQRKKQQKKARELKLKAAQQGLQGTAKIEHVILSDSDHQHLKIQAKLQREKPQREKIEFTINNFVLQKLIDIYTYNAYDLYAISKQLPHLRQAQIRQNLQVLFTTCINKVHNKYSKRSSNKASPALSMPEKSRLIGEFFKKKRQSSLLGESSHFNQYFNKILYSTVNKSITIETPEIQYLWDRMIGFLRGEPAEVKRQALLRSEDGTLAKQEVNVDCEEVKREEELQPAYIAYVKVQQEVKQQTA